MPTPTKSLSEQLAALPDDFAKLAPSGHLVDMASGRVALELQNLAENLEALLYHIKTMAFDASVIASDQRQEDAPRVLLTVDGKRVSRFLDA